jgi:hypothetical protein
MDHTPSVTLSDLKARHLSLISRPQEIADLIRQAARRR